MNHIRILKRSWQITWNYRLLWVFGFLLALTSARGGAQGTGYRFNGNDLENFFNGGQIQIPKTPEMFSLISGIGASLLILFLSIGALFAIAAAVAHYVSQTALFRMVNQHEIDESKVKLLEGLRLGWTRSTFHIFLMDLLIGLIAFIIGALLVLLAGIPLLSWLTDSNALHAIGTVSSIFLGFLVLLILIIAGVFVNVTLHLARRVCVLEKRNVIDSIQIGIDLVRANLADIIMMAFILFGLGLGFAIAMIPIFLILLFLALLLGGVPGFLVYTLASSFMEGTAPYLVGGLIAFPIFFLILVIPTSIIGGIFEAFKSSVWTLTYRTLHSPIGEGKIEPEILDNPPGEPTPLDEKTPDSEE